MRGLCLAAAALMAWSVPAWAQQSTQSPSATQPGQGRFLFRQTVTYMDYGDDPTGLGRDFQEVRTLSEITYGLTPEIAIKLDVPYIVRDGDTPTRDADDHGFGDLHIMGKWRIWKDDYGPINTKRLTLLAGLDLPTSQEPFGNRAWDPMLGIAYTQVHERHGINAALRYHMTTDGPVDGAAVHAGDSLADVIHYDSAYLFRIDPAVYTIDTQGAWYAMFEAGGTVETNGDHDLKLAPGIMYEDRRWVVELSVQIPVYQEVDHRLEHDWTLTAGFRYLF